MNLEADDTQTLYWHIESSFGRLNELKSHIGLTYSIGSGSICNESTK